MWTLGLLSSGSGPKGHGTHMVDEDTTSQVSLYSLLLPFYPCF